MGHSRRDKGRVVKREPTIRPPHSRPCDHGADVVVVGAGAAGLVAAIAARDHGASVIVIDANDDVGGRAILSAGRICLGGGTSVQKRYGISDSADRLYLDHTDHRLRSCRFNDRDLVRVWADENVGTFEFLIANGVRFVEAEPLFFPPATVPRMLVTELFSPNFQETINGADGSGLVRPLEISARKKGVKFLLRHRLSTIHRESREAGSVTGITARTDEANVNIEATSGVIIATGGHSGNVELRRMFDPRLTEEYQVSGEPWTRQTGDGEIAAMAVGASLGATANATCDSGFALSKTLHIGCRWGYRVLKWHPNSPVFKLAGASGLTVSDPENLILVNQVGLRFWNELDDSLPFVNACLGTNGNLGRDGKANGGGPIWAIFDSDAAAREGWDVRPPHVDPNGWFFSANTLTELANRISNPYQRRPIPSAALAETVHRYNSFVDQGADPDFGRAKPKYKIQAPPFYAAWSTPMVHECLTGLKITPGCQVVDTNDRVIPGLYCAGESAGGFAFHGLTRVLVFGRIAGREAAGRYPLSPSSTGG